MRYSLSDILDVKKLQHLSDSYSSMTGMATAIIDLEGKILTRSGWSDICTKFHRVNPKTAEKCIESDTILAGKLARGEQYNVYSCKNGLVDIAVPIVIEDNHVKPCSICG